MASWKSNEVAAGDPRGGLGLGVDAVVAFSVGDVAKRGAGERNLRFGDDVGVGVVAATSPHQSEKKERSGGNGLTLSATLLGRESIGRWSF